MIMLFSVNSALAIAFFAISRIITDFKIKKESDVNICHKIIEYHEKTIVEIVLSLVLVTIGGLIYKYYDTIVMFLG